MPLELYVTGFKRPLKMDQLAARRFLATVATTSEIGCLMIFTSRSPSQPIDDTDDLPDDWPPTSAVRTKRALRAAPVVLVCGVRMPAYAETGESTVSEHSRCYRPRSLGRRCGLR